MSELKLKQLYYESDTWKRSLGFLIDENIHLKNRLIEILQTSEDEGLLGRAEYFHDRFIKEDERISLIRNDLTEFDNLLIREVPENGKFAKEINKKFTTLRNNILNAEKQFSELKSEFSNFMLESFITAN